MTDLYRVRGKMIYPNRITGNMMDLYRFPRNTLELFSPRKNDGPLEYTEI